MPRYKKGNKILTQKELKEAAKNKMAVWAEYRLPDPSDKCKEMNKAVIPEATLNNDGFYIGDACWDNVDNDEDECVSDGFDGDTLIIYEATSERSVRGTI